MPSVHSYAPGEILATYSPYGWVWLRDRLLAAGRTNPLVSDDPGTPGNTLLRVDEANVSKSQLAFDVQAQDGELAVNQNSFNVPTSTTHAVTVTGPVGKLVKVRFDGPGGITETEFTIPGNGNYDFIFGPYPTGLRLVVPQMYDFYVEDGSCSPVAVMVTFK